MTPTKFTGAFEGHNAFIILEQVWMAYVITTWEIWIWISSCIAEGVGMKYWLDKQYILLTWAPKFDIVRLLLDLLCVKWFFNKYIAWNLPVSFAIKLSISRAEFGAQNKKT